MNEKAVGVGAVSNLCNFERRLVRALDTYEVAMYSNIYQICVHFIHHICHIDICA